MTEAERITRATSITQRLTVAQTRGSSNRGYRQFHQGPRIDTLAQVADRRSTTPERR